MHIVSGLFDTYQHATEAVHALDDLGIGGADISLIANSPEDAPSEDLIGSGATTGAEAGAALGGLGGLLAGLGLIAIPGLGPVLAGGWLLATAVGVVAGAGVGAAAGGIIAALTASGIPEEDAHVYAEGLKRGGALVTAKVPERQGAVVHALFEKLGAVDVSERRRSYEAEGWTRFEADALRRGKPDA